MYWSSVHPQEDLFSNYLGSAMEGLMAPEAAMGVGSVRGPPLHNHEITFLAIPKDFSTSFELNSAEP